jgi:hypothetical protein
MEDSELSYYKTSGKYPYFSDFEGQNLMPNDIKPLRQTARVTEFEAKGLLIKVEKPQEEVVEEEIVTPIANVPNSKSKSKS